VPFDNGMERATINGVQIVRQNGRYWIMTHNGPQWSDIGEKDSPWRQAQLRGRQEELWPGRKLFYLAAFPVILSFALLLVVITVAMVKFGNL
jgi:hypothetical protein